MKYKTGDIVKYRGNTCRILSASSDRYHDKIYELQVIEGQDRYRGLTVRTCFEDELEKPEEQFPRDYDLDFDDPHGDVCNKSKNKNYGNVIADEVKKGIQLILTSIEIPDSNCDCGWQEKEVPMRAHSEFCSKRKYLESRRK